MNIHEYHAKEILSGYDIPVPRGRVCLTADQVERAAKMMGGHCVVKAQIYAGGRGKAGGVKVVHHPEQAQELAKELFARKLVTPQTGPEGGRALFLSRVRGGRVTGNALFNGRWGWYCLSGSDGARAKEHSETYIRLAPNDPDAATAQEMIKYLK